MSTSTLARLNVLLTADTGEFQRSMTSAAEKMQEMGDRMVSVGSAMSARVTAPIAAVGAALLAATVKVGNMADALLDLEQQTGLSTVSLQEFRHVATIAGVAQDTVADAAMKLQQRLSGVGEESGKVQDTLDMLGVSVRNTDGSFRAMDDMLPEIIHQLQGMEDITYRNTLATELFGRGAIALAPVLGMTAEEFENARDQAHALGLVMERDALDAANEFREGFDTLQKQFGAVVAEIGLAVLPIMNRLVQIMQRHVIPAARRVAQFIGNVSPPVQLLIAGIAGIIAAIGPLLVIFGTVVKVAGFVAAALAALNPVTIAVVAAIATVVVAGTVLAENWDRIAGFLRGIWDAIQNTFTGAVNRIVGLLTGLKQQATNVVQTMMDAILSVITGIFGRVVDAVTNGVDRVLGLFRNMRREAVGNSIIPDMMDGILAEFREMEQWMPESTEIATDATLDEFDGMFNTVMKHAKKFLGDFGFEWGGLGDMIAKPFESLQKISTDWLNFFKSLGEGISSFWNRIKGFWDKLTRFWEALGRVSQGPALPGQPFQPTFGPGFGRMTAEDMNGSGMAAMGIGSGFGGMVTSLSVENVYIDARGTTDPEGTGQSVASAFIEELDRALGDSSLRESRFDGMMMAT